jgi:hypothetical protein
MDDWVVVPSACHVCEEVANVVMLMNLPFKTPLLHTVLRTRSPVLLSLRDVKLHALLSRWIALETLCAPEVRRGDLYWHPHPNQMIDQIRVALYVPSHVHSISSVRAHIGRFGFVSAPFYDLDRLGYDSKRLTIKVRHTKAPKQKGGRRSTV